MKLRLGILFLFSFFTVHLNAQPGGGDPHRIGTLKGKIIDSSIMRPVEYANLILFRENSVFYDGATSDSTGKFLINKIEPGKYYLKINFIGYKEKIIKNLEFTAQKPLVDLDTIYLVQAATALGEAVVVGEKAVMEYNLDKKVFNVDKDLTSTAGNGLDVLKNIPSVTVDVDGNVSLRGSGNVNVLIDGKPSSLSATQLLEQIPASMILSIEIITNPSAKYDPDGMSGIINVVTKKSKEPGYNGNINLTAGTRNKYTGTVSLNYKVKKINIFGSYDFRYNQRYGYSDINRWFSYNDTLTYVDQYSDRLNKGTNQTAKAGMDIYISDKQTLTVTGTYRSGNQKKTEDITYDSYDDQNLISDQSMRKNAELAKDHSSDVMLNYRKSFATKGREWTADATWSNSYANTDLSATNNYSVVNYISDNSMLQQHNLRTDKNNVITLQTDYIHPTEKSGRFEMGLKSIIRNYETDLLFENYIDSTADWQSDTNITNDFVYKDALIAGYFIYGNSFKKIQYQAGLRAEQMFTESFQLTTNDRHVYNYFNVFPSIHFKYPLAKEKEVSLSYSRRINRPGPHSLNPFPEYSDPYNLRMGNPYLKPEYVNAFETGFIKYFKKWTFNSTLYFRQTDNVIMRFRTIDSLGVTRMSQLNLATSKSSGVDLVLTITPVPILRMTLSGSAYYYYQAALPEYNLNKVETFLWNAKFNSNLTIKKGFDAQLSGYYTAPMTTSQGEMRAMYSFDLGMKKDVLKGKGSFTLRVSDILNTQQFWVYSQGPTFYVDSKFKRESQIVYLGFTYKINGGNNRRDKQIQGSPEGGGDFGM